MENMSNVKRRLITSMISILLLVITIFGITYAYFTSRTRGNTNTKSAEVSAGRLELVYRDGNGLIELLKIEPGTTLDSKTFTVTNTGTALIEDYEVILEDVINELKYYKDLTFVLSCTSSSGTCNGSNGIFPNNTASIVTNSIDVGVTHTYTLTVTYNETNTDQSDDMNKTVSAKVNIRDEYKNYTNLKIYGNSTTDGSTEIKSLGNLVTDTSDNNYGKYEIDVTANNKNLLKFVTPEVTNGIIVETLENGAIVKGKTNAEGAGGPNWSAGWYKPSQNVTDGTGVVKLNYNDTVTLSVYLTFLEKYSSTSTQQIALMLWSEEGGTIPYSYIYNSLGNALLNKTYRISHTYTNSNSRFSNSHFHPIITLNSNTVKIEKMQIEKGNVATEYIPYREPLNFNIYLKEPLRKLNDTADYIDVLNRKVVRNINVDGSGNMSVLATPIEENIQIIDSNELVDRTLEVSDGELEASSITSTYDK